MVGIVYVYVDSVFGFYGYFFFYCVVRCLSMIVWTPAVLCVSNRECLYQNGVSLLYTVYKYTILTGNPRYACVLYFGICICSAQLSMLHMEKRFRNTLIIIIIMIVKCMRDCWSCSLAGHCPAVSNVSAQRPPQCC